MFVENAECKAVSLSIFLREIVSARDCLDQHLGEASSQLLAHAVTAKTLTIYIGNRFGLRLAIWVDAYARFGPDV